MVEAREISEWFAGFVDQAEPKLRHAFVVALGQDVGVEATSIALAYGWEHREELFAMDNPAGYLYRVGRSRVGRERKQPVFLPVPAEDAHLVEPGLPSALGELSEMQRTAVMMVHADGWTRAEAAAALEISLSTLDTHLARGLSRLRSRLGVSPRV